MASFVKGPVGGGKPFGKNEFLRSTQDVKYESYTFAAASLPAVGGQKILQPGTVVAKITSGDDAGKIGAFSADALDGRQTLTNIVGINSTFLPWQLLERDVEVAVVVEGRVVQAWCLEFAAGGAAVALTDTTAAGLVGKKSVSILFS